MKPFLGIDITTNRKNERLNGNEFLILKPSEILSQTLAKTTEQKDVIIQKSKTKMYIQNPPKNIREQIYRTFDKSIIHETQQPYLEVSKEMIQTFNRQYSERVIGQEKSKKK